MWKLKKNGEKIQVYGWIVQSKPLISYQRTIGYKFVIKTTVSIELNGVNIPIYITFSDKNENRELYEFFVKNRRQKTPIRFEGRKKGQRKYKNTKLKNIENADYILWVFPWANSKLYPLTEGIPEKFLNLKVTSSS